VGFFVLIGIVVRSALWNVGGAGVIFGLVIAFLLVLVEFSVQPFLGFQPIEYVLLDKFRTLIVVITLIVGVITLLCSHNEFNVSRFRAKRGAEMSVLLTLIFSVFIFISAN